MANTYLLLIDQLYVQPVQNLGEETELINVVTKVDWRIKGTSETGTISNFIGTKMLGSPNLENYTPYDDVTYEMAQDWCWLSEEEKSNIYQVIDSQIDIIEQQKYLKPDTMPWEVLPPGQAEIDAQNAQNEE